jgi:RNA recognition motif-containing protein
MSRKLFVGNLPYETMEQDLETLFGQAGQVETVSVMRDRVTGRARGFAFVEMASDEDAQKAITQLNGHQMGGRALTVNEARPQAARPGGGGGFGGGGGGAPGGRGARGGQSRPGRRTDPRW